MIERATGALRAGGGKTLWARTLRASVLLDLSIIVAVALIFARPVLDFDDEVTPAATDDWEPVSALMVLARDSILDHAEFPLWNPYFGTGQPYMGDPMVYVLNPVASVPGLLFGAHNGAKVAAALSMAVAGLGMYYLATVLGAARPFRVWAALTLALSGSIAARVWAGHFNFVTGLAYVPWVFALVFQALRRGGVVYPMLAGLASALLFFAGHVHYTIFAMPGVAVTFLIALAAAGWHDERWSATRCLPVLLRGLAVGGWTLGFSAVQLVPYLENGEAFSAGTYPELIGSQTLFASAENFFIPNIDYLNNLFLGRGWGWWEYYAYVGLVPLLGLALVLAALGRPDRRPAIVWAALLFGFYLSWAAAEHTFFEEIYGAFPWLYHLRVPSRTLAFASPFLIGLAALGLSHAFDRALTLRRWPAALAARSPALPAWATPGLLLALLLAGACFYGLRDVFDTNRQVLEAFPRPYDHEPIVRFLRERDSSVFSVAATSDLLGPTPGVERRIITSGSGWGVPPEFYEAGIKRLDAVWAFSFQRDLGSAPVSITPRAKYLIGAPQDGSTDAELIGTVQGKPIYRLQLSPPYASTLSSDDAPTTEFYPWSHKTREADARIVSANVIEVRAEPGPGHDRLLVLESYHSGWRLEVDGKRAGKPDNYGGFLSAGAGPGTHTYTFVFDPASFRYGAAATLGTIIGAILLLLSRLPYRPWRERAERSRR